MRVLALMFVVARDMPMTEENTAQPASNSTAASGNEVSKKLSGEGALKTTMPVKALKKFPSTLRAICVVPSLNKNYPYEVLADSIKQHPPDSHPLRYTKAKLQDQILSFPRNQRAWMGYM